MENDNEKGRAMPDWIASNFNKNDIIMAIKRKDNPNWGGKGSGETLHGPKINKERYSWGELRKTPHGILAVLAWEHEVRKADFIDAYSNELVVEKGIASLKKSYKLQTVLLGHLGEEE